MGREINDIELLKNLPNLYLGKTEKAESAKVADSVNWTNVLNKPSTFQPSAHNHDNYLSLSGGTITGNITKTGAGAGFVVSYGTSRTMMYASTTQGEHIFGGSNNGSLEVTDYVRVTPGSLKYVTGGNTYEVYHTGKKPSATDIGALPLTGGTISGDLGITGALQLAGVNALRSNGASTILSCKTGYMYFRPNGDTNTAGQVSITLAGKVIAPSFNTVNDGVVGQSTRQELEISGNTLSFANTIEGTKKYASIAMQNNSLEFNANSFYIYAGTGGFNVPGKILIGGKGGCSISDSGLNANADYGFNMGDTMRLGTIFCTSVVQMSDKETKEEIKYINNREENLVPADFYDFFLKDFKPVSFKYKNRQTDTPELGFIAQDIKQTKLADYILIERPNQLLAFNNYSYTSSIAIALQQAIRKIEYLEDQLFLLKNKINK